MEKEEFFDLMNERADNYAWEMIGDPENHQDAVERCKDDFMEGVYAAYETLVE